MILMGNKEDGKKNVYTYTYYISRSVHTFCAPLYSHVKIKI